MMKWVGCVNIWGNNAAYLGYSVFVMIFIFIMVLTGHSDYLRCQDQGDIREHGISAGESALQCGGLVGSVEMLPRIANLFNIRDTELRRWESHKSEGFVFIAI